MLAEWHRASRRYMELRMSADACTLGPGNAPDNYAESLFWTAGPLRHELSARERPHT